MQNVNTSTNQMTKTGLARRCIILGAVMGTLASFGLSGAASAQSPTPTASFLDSDPYYPATGPAGDVVEGAGMLNCAEPTSVVESATLWYIRHDQPVWTEISPQDGGTEGGNCGTYTQYESLVDTITNYIESQDESGAETYWLGFMLDEEPWYGISASNLESLNTSVFNEVDSTGGITWWSNEIANASGWWSQTQYNQLTDESYPAPQIYNGSMVTYATDSGEGEQMVTWWTSSAYPYNSESFCDGQISGEPPEFFGKYWDNQYQNA